MDDMNISIEIGRSNNIDELEKLYDDLNDYLSSGINYSGWAKGIYPTREDASVAIKNKHLYMAKYENKIVGTVVINNIYDESYDDITWDFEGENHEIFVVHTLAVHPDYMRFNIAEKLLGFVQEHAKEHGAKAIRLDVYEKNIPAIKLYEKLGYTHMGKVDLGFSKRGLQWYKVYEKLI